MLEAVTFQTKPELARHMLARVRQAGVPARWVTAGEVYGSERRLRVWMEAQGIAHVLAVKRPDLLWALTEQGPAQVAAETIAGQVLLGDWQRRSAGDGAKGPRLYDWVRLPIRPLGDPDNGYWLTRACLQTEDRTGVNLVMLRPQPKHPYPLYPRFRSYGCFAPTAVGLSMTYITDLSTL